MDAASGTRPVEHFQTDHCPHRALGTNAVQTAETTLRPVQKGNPTMPNLKERILDVVKGGPNLSCLASTRKDGKPLVRLWMAEASDDLTFRFTSHTNARKIAQIESNPESHLT